MKNLKNIIPLLSLLIAAGALCYAYWSQPQTAYVNLNEVYQEFLLKKGLEKKLVSFSEGEQYYLDSLQAQIGSLAQKLEKKSSTEDLELFKNTQREYAYSRQMIAEREEALATEYDEKIWTQLNQYVRDFSEKEGYDYILGANGTGSIMGGKAEFNKTKEIIQYINQRYNGIMD